MEQLAGLVERVTFHNADTGFCVLRLKVRGERDLITLVGHAPSVTPGEYATASGQWISDREHGRQFKAVFVKIAPPTTLAGIERYLGSGMVKGIGPACAARLVAAFGGGVFEAFEQSVARLREIGGIVDKRAKKITRGWADQTFRFGAGSPTKCMRNELRGLLSGKAELVSVVAAEAKRLRSGDRSVEAYEDAVESSKATQKAQAEKAS